MTKASLTPTYPVFQSHQAHTHAVEASYSSFFVLAGFSAIWKYVVVVVVVVVILFIIENNHPQYAHLSIFIYNISDNNYYNIYGIPFTKNPPCTEHITLYNNLQSFGNISAALIMIH